jgi:hypothetical protein
MTRASARIVNGQTRLKLAYLSKGFTQNLPV